MVLSDVEDVYDNDYLKDENYVDEGAVGRDFSKKLKLHTNRSRPNYYEGNTKLMPSQRSKRNKMVKTNYSNIIQDVIFASKVSPLLPKNYYIVFFI